MGQDPHRNDSYRLRTPTDHAGEAVEILRVGSRITVIGNRYGSWGGKILEINDYNVVVELNTMPNGTPLQGEPITETLKLSEVIKEQ